MLKTVNLQRTPSTMDTFLDVQLFVETERGYMSGKSFQIYCVQYGLGFPRTTGNPQKDEQFSLFRVSTQQGKQGIWFLLFPDRENTGNFVLTQGKYLDCDY